MNLQPQLAHAHKNSRGWERAAGGGVAGAWAQAGAGGGVAGAGSGGGCGSGRRGAGGGGGDGDSGGLQKLYSP